MKSLWKTPSVAPLKISLVILLKTVSTKSSKISSRSHAVNALEIPSATQKSLFNNSHGNWFGDCLLDNFFDYSSGSLFKNFLDILSNTLLETSFLRIGISLAIQKVISFAISLNIFSVNSLEITLGTMNVLCMCHGEQSVVVQVVKNNDPTCWKGWMIICYRTSLAVSFNIFSGDVLETVLILRISTAENCFSNFFENSFSYFIGNSFCNSFMNFL